MFLIIISIRNGVKLLGLPLLEAATLIDRSVPREHLVYWRTAGRLTGWGLIEYCS
jgi:hypothetical protein